MSNDKLQRYTVEVIAPRQRSHETDCSYRVTDTRTDSRIATCWQRSNADLIVDALNTVSAEGLSKPLGYCLLNAKGEMHWGESCISSSKGEMLAEAELLHDGDPEGGWHAAPFYSVPPALPSPERRTTGGDPAEPRADYDAPSSEPLGTGATAAPAPDYFEMWQNQVEFAERLIEQNKRAAAKVREKENRVRQLERELAEARTRAETLERLAVSARETEKALYADRERLSAVRNRGAQMKFYRVHYSQQGGNSAGFSWHTSKRDAEASAREAVENDPDEYVVLAAKGPTIHVVEIEPTKAGILEALNRYADHPDNG